MANQLVYVTGFPFNSIVLEQFLLVSDGKKMASVAIVTNDSVIGDDTIEVKAGDDEPYEVEYLDEAFNELQTRFGAIVEKTEMTHGQARAARLIG